MSFQDEVVKIRNGILSKDEYRIPYEALTGRIAESQKAPVEKAVEKPEDEKGIEIV